MAWLVMPRASSHASHPPGTDGVDRNGLSGALQGHRAGPAEYAVLGGGVSFRRTEIDLCRGGGDVDNAGAGWHQQAAETSLLLPPPGADSPRNRRR